MIHRLIRRLYGLVDKVARQTVFLTMWDQLGNVSLGRVRLDYMLRSFVYREERRALQQTRDPDIRKAKRRPHTNDLIICELIRDGDDLAWEFEPILPSNEQGGHGEDASG
jgi:hypothetical protein